MIVTVDASVAVKWYFEEELSDVAARLLSPTHTLLAPDLLIPEFANVAWKYVRQGSASVMEARRAVTALLGVNLTLYSAEALMPMGFDIACEWGRSAYDSLYLAFARLEGVQLVTADRRFYNAMQGTPLSGTMLWMEDLL